MTLINVTETYQSEAAPRASKFKPVYPLKPPVDLSDTEVFSRHGGYTFDAFATMREKAPVMWHPEQMGTGFWAVSTYELVKHVELHPAIYSSQKGGILMNYGMEGVPRHPLMHSASLNSLINLDRPYHTPLRMEHMAYFRADFVSELRKRVDAEVTRLLDNLERHGPVVDMVEHFSAELPLFTLCEILGVPPADRPKLVHWMHFLELSQYQAQQEGLGNVTPEQIMTFMTEIQAMFEYGRYLLEERRKNPQPDLLSAIANVKVEGKPLSPEFLDGSWLLIVFAGNHAVCRAPRTAGGRAGALPEFRQRGDPHGDAGHLHAADRDGRHGTGRPENCRGRKDRDVLSGRQPRSGKVRDAR
jgi:cytochrome P450